MENRDHSVAHAAVGDIGRDFAIPASIKLIIGLIAGGAVLVSLLSAPSVIGLAGSALAVTMLAIAVIDWQRFIIPDVLSACGLGLAVLNAAAREPYGMLDALVMAALRAATLALLFLAVREAYARIRGREGLGLGDVKLAAVAGAWLDWSMMPIAIEIAALAALSGYLVGRYALGRPVTPLTRMPFGLFLAPAIWVCWLIEANFVAP